VFAVSCFFAAAATTALLGGGIVDRLGRRRGTVLAGPISVLGGAGLAWGARSYAALVVSLIVLGIANAAMQVTSNLSLAKSIPPRRQGVAFGVKQSAIPFAIVLGGLAVPSVGVIIGWRWTFGITAILATWRLWVACSFRGSQWSRRRHRGRWRRHRRWPLP
jgi:MFS family permease